MKQPTQALVERTMEALNLWFALTEHLGYENHDQSEKLIANRRNGKNTQELRADHGPMGIEVPAGYFHRLGAEGFLDAVV
jgi:transposase-like protein